jgi:CO/xanthine dehydrogenase Mo-binding subunit
MIGLSLDRVDAISKVKGEALYPGDVNFPDQLYMKVKFSDHAHAVVRSIDIIDALKVNGVLAIFTARDVPNNEYGLIYADQPVLCGPGSNNPFGDRVRFIGDQVAIIIAETEKAAEAARKLIRIDYEDLPVISSIDEARKENAVILHPEKESNNFCHYQIRRGDIAAAFSNAFCVVEDVYNTPVQEHVFLQPEAGVSFYDDQGRITVIVGGQWIHEDQEQIAHALNLPKEKIRVIYPAIGGAFGGREDMSVQIILGLATLKLGEMGIYRPVKIVWTREESIIGHHKRHAYRIHSKWAADRDGKLLAAKIQIQADGGAYIYTSTKVMANATLMCTGPYNIPNVEVDADAYYTNNIPGGAFRGFGGPQAAFSAETQINKIAEKLGLDPVEIRKRNVLKEGDLLSVGTPLPPGVSLDQVVDKCADISNWSDKGMNATTNTTNKQRGIGFACSYKNVGFSYGAPENCWAIIELHGRSEIEKVILRHAGAEVGQGSHTVFIQMAAHALGVSPEIIELDASDTADSNNSGSVSASRMTFMAGNAIKGAAEEALSKWKNEERPAISHFQYWAPKTSPFDKETGECTPNFAYGYVAEAVEVEVDVETGQIEVTKVTCVDDVGNAVNPTLIEGQIEGAIVQAHGYGLTENFIQRNGHALTNKLSTYLIPTVLDIPDTIHSEIMEVADHNGPWGIKGMGEMPLLPYVPALVAAVHNATEIWFNDFPLTPEKVYFALKRRKSK